MSACTDRPTGETQGEGDGSGALTDGVGTTSGVSATGGASQGMTGGGTTAAGLDTGGSTTGLDDAADVLFDLGRILDAPPPVDLLGCHPGPAELTDFACEDPLDPTLEVYGCLQPHADGTCPPFGDPTVAASLQECEFSCALLEMRCGPDPGVLDACCYWGEIVGQTCPGRPFTVEGRARLAALHEGARPDWSAQPQLDDLDGLVRALDPATREGLAVAWAEDGQFEHASVASFARFTLHLLSLGAPPSLVALAQRAMAEEIEHAQTFFGLASALAGRAVGPGPLDVRGGLDAHDPVAIVVAAVCEGCIAETISARQIAAARDGARHPGLRARLATIAAQELAHAELAWRFVAWALHRGDDRLRSAVAEAFMQAGQAVPRGASEPTHLADDRLRALGRVPQADRVRIAARTLEQVIMPCAQALLAPWTCAAAPTRTTRAAASMATIA